MLNILDRLKIAWIVNDVTSKPEHLNPYLSLYVLWAQFTRYYVLQRLCISDMKNKIQGFSTVSCYFLVKHSCNTLNSDINRTFHVTDDVASIEYHTKMKKKICKKRAKIEKIKAVRPSLHLRWRWIQQIRKYESPLVADTRQFSVKRSIYTIWHLYILRHCKRHSLTHSTFPMQMSESNEIYINHIWYGPGYLWCNIKIHSLHLYRMNCMPVCICNQAHFFLSTRIMHLYHLWRLSITLQCEKVAENRRSFWIISKLWNKN